MPLTKRELFVLRSREGRRHLPVLALDLTCRVGREPVLIVRGREVIRRAA